MKKVRNLFRRLYLEYLNWLKKKPFGTLRKDDNRIQIFCDRQRFFVNIQGNRVEYDNYDDWKLIQTLKGKPDWLKKNWETTKDKQLHIWNFAGVQKGMQMLEVGFRDGYNLQYLQRIGVQVCGIEVNPYAVQHALKLGCQVWEEDIQQNTHFSARQFDLVSACDVLEHCFAPEQALLEIHRILKDEGKVVIEIPFENEFSQNLVHGHSALFRSAEYAENIFKETGFYVIKKDVNCVSRNPYLLGKQTYGSYE